MYILLDGKTNSLDDKDFPVFSFPPDKQGTDDEAELAIKYWQNGRYCIYLCERTEFRERIADSLNDRGLLQCYILSLIIGQEGEFEGKFQNQKEE